MARRFSEKEKDNFDTLLTLLERLEGWMWEISLYLFKKFRQNIEVIILNSQNIHFIISKFLTWKISELAKLSKIFALVI